MGTLSFPPSKWETKTPKCQPPRGARVSGKHQVGEGPESGIVRSDRIQCPPWCGTERTPSKRLLNCGEGTSRNRAFPGDLAGEASGPFLLVSEGADPHISEDPPQKAPVFSLGSLPQQSRGTCAHGGDRGECEFGRGGIAWYTAVTCGSPAADLI